MAKQEVLLKTESNSGEIILYSDLSSRCEPWALDLFLLPFSVIFPFSFQLFLSEVVETGLVGKH